MTRLVLAWSAVVAALHLIGWIDLAGWERPLIAVSLIVAAGPELVALAKEGLRDHP